jgi:hypothetical protein
MKHHRARYFLTSCLDLKQQYYATTGSSGFVEASTNTESARAAMKFYWFGPRALMGVPGRL